MDKQLVLQFKAIHGFVIAVGELYKDKQKSLALYYRLISQTTFSHTVAMTKHVSAFEAFCSSNSKAIETQQVNDICEPIVKYSERAFIDIKKILLLSDEDTQKAIWEHLLTITALVVPSSADSVKEILKKYASTNKNETEFVTDFMSKLESEAPSIDSANPMEAIQKIMSSGMIENLMAGIGSGDGGFDISKLVGIATSMLGSLSQVPQASGGAVVSEMVIDRTSSGGTTIEEKN